MADVNGNVTVAPDRRKRNISCDVCRSRKIRCDKRSGRSECDGCIDAQVQCTYGGGISKIRKPYGQPIGSVPPIASASTAGPHELYPSPQRRHRSQPAPTVPVSLPEHSDASSSTPAHPVQDFSSSALATLDGLLEPEEWLPDSFPLTNFGTTARTDQANTTLGVESGHSPTIQPSPSRSTLSVPASKDEPSVEQIIKWDTLLETLSLFRSKLYPRLPIVHWPTFSQDLVERRDKRDLPFRAFLFALVAYTILQLPNGVFTTISQVTDLRALHRVCYHSSRQLRPLTYTRPSLDFVRASYCNYIYLRSTEQPTAADMTLAEAARMAGVMGFHDDTTGGDLDFIEREMRKRVFWLIYGSDRTTGALTVKPMIIHDEDITIDEPLEVADDYLTRVGCFSQPEGQVPVISGFTRVTRIFRLLSRVLSLIRSARRPETRNLLDMQFYIDQISDIRNLLQIEIESLPAPLNILAEASTEEANPAGAQSGSGSGGSSDAQGFETCKANILVTQALARFELLQLAYMLGVPGQLDATTESVLKRLDLAPSDVLTANGSSMRHKVYFIASFLITREDLQLPEEITSLLRKVLQSQPDTSDGADAAG